ncbi:glycine betaine ABC transporter substrate-binding protein [Bacillaceae bacterium IKA-2]|nr:glycine betaine ABC transporter substrate-binding protein [Bacillaceae bacterium IKA-2]
MQKKSFYIVGNILIFVCMILLVSCSSKTKILEEIPTNTSDLPTITIGSKLFTEQYILMTMTSLLLRDNSYKVNEIRFLDSPTIRNAIEQQVIDIYWEYTSTARIIFHKQPVIYDFDEVYNAVKEYDEIDNLIWLERSDFNSSWGVIVRNLFADKHQLVTISDLIGYMKENDAPLKFATNDEFLIREDGLGHLQQVYDLSLNDHQVLPVDTSLLTLAVKEGRVGVSIGMISDSRISEYDLIVLHDDQQAFPSYHATPVATQELVEEHPTVKILLNQLSKSITHQDMIELNYQVDVLQNDVIKVAKAFLIEKGLLN